MRFKIGVFGSAIDETPETSLKAQKLGEILGLQKNVELITGACSGLPYKVASVAAKNGTGVIGFSPEINIDGQKKFTPNNDLSIYKQIHFVPKSFSFHNNSLVCKKYRNVISTANCDAGIIICGRYGTLNEFTNLYDMGKIIGILTKTGGIADEIENLNSKIIKKSKAKLFFDDNPEELVKKIMDALLLSF